MVRRAWIGYEYVQEAKARNWGCCTIEEEEEEEEFSIC